MVYPNYDLALMVPPNTGGTCCSLKQQQQLEKAKPKKPRAGGRGRLPFLFFQVYLLSYMLFIYLRSIPKLVFRKGAREVGVIVGAREDCWICTAAPKTEKKEQKSTKNEEKTVDPTPSRDIHARRTDIRHTAPKTEKKDQKSTKNEEKTVDPTPSRDIHARRTDIRHTAPKTEKKDQKSTKNEEKTVDPTPSV